MKQVKTKDLAAVYSFFVGASMIGMWAAFYVSGQIPELETEPVRVSLHITAEVVTGISLIVGASGLYRNWSWGFRAYLLSMGMLLYTLIVSPGYYAEKGVMELVGMFVVFIVISAAFIILTLRKPDEFESQA